LECISHRLVMWKKDLMAGHLRYWQT